MYIGDQEASFEANEVIGKSMKIGDERYYKISNVAEMRPFFMSIVSNSNHWMFISSSSGLSAGRKNSENALFPYYTDDKITESAEITGSKTLLQVRLNDKTYLWEPFSNRYLGIYKTQRNLYKNLFGNKIIFEEINFDLGITFTYHWNSSDEYGFVKKSCIVNNTDAPIQVTVLDGIQNIIPYGVSPDLQNSASNLVDAYKKSELETEVGLGIYALSAIIVDKAEPSEALKASMVWSVGIENPTYLLSSLQLDNFRKGKLVHQETDVKAEKGAYFICFDLTLKPQSEKKWMIIADVNQSVIAINRLKNMIKNETDLASKINADIESGTQKLIELAGAADGMQLTADRLQDTRHFANTLFNIMRGGIFDDNYQIDRKDFSIYIAKANKKVYTDKESFINQLPEVFSLQYLKEKIKNEDNKDFKRLLIEYLPLKFSRRHGDPSRPWNKFSINTKNEIDGSKVLDYQGNWRDIFQNWEALAHSYPAFIDSMIHKFVNASTFEGYNPYRVTKDGFDWEIIEPNDPWSFIGYWGDHQIIYLLKFLEIIESHYPNKLSNYFNDDLFVYANVPYKIKTYEEMLVNSKDTIEFNKSLDKKLSGYKKEIGADGALITLADHTIYHVNLIEKLLTTVLSKVSNFIPEGGIWMNTQRPEWNDANNALVGNGVSVVTLCYLRRFINFFEGIVTNSTLEKSEISKELTQFFHQVVTTLKENKAILHGKVSNTNRKSVLDGLGTAGSNYRTQIYDNGFSGAKETISRSDLLEFFEITKKYLNHTIAANKRADNLFHAYNLMTVTDKNEVVISHLSEMLEGQVAVLSSGYISGADSLELLDALKGSALFRPDQYSYTLYPNKELSRFTNKNNIPQHSVDHSELLQSLLKNGNKQVIEKDCFGDYHFNGSFNNANSLVAALGNLDAQYQYLVVKERKQLLAVFEEVFNHKSFTGRSGTFFGYEGLGSIYWHMVSKLLLSVQETCLSAIEHNENAITVGKLLEHYYEINAGIGVHKSPELYGAFPTDPYSHTPAGKGAQQPGMTGQVKEDILSRFGELGLFILNGEIHFNPHLLRKTEFLQETKRLKYPSIDKELKELYIEKDSLCYTYCQIPVIYKLSDKNQLKLIFKDKAILEFDELKIDQVHSKKIFNRTGEIVQIIIELNRPLL